MTNIVSSIRKYPWPSGIIGFFLLLTVWHGWLLSTAFSGQPARVTVNAYKDSLVFQERINQRRLAKKAIQKKKISISKINDGQLISLSIVKDEAYKFSKTIELTFQRADTTRLDQSIRLTRAESKRPQELLFEGKAQLPVSGLWLLQLHFEINGKKAELEERLFVDNTLL